MDRRDLLSRAHDIVAHSLDTSPSLASPTTFVPTGSPQQNVRLPTTFTSASKSALTVCKLGSNMTVFTADVILALAAQGKDRIKTIVHALASIKSPTTAVSSPSRRHRRSGRQRQGTNRSAARHRLGPLPPFVRVDSGPSAAQRESPATVTGAVRAVSVP
jgi:hypothetical protein